MTGKVVDEHGEVRGHTRWERCAPCKGNGAIGYTGHANVIVTCPTCGGHGGQYVVDWIKKDPRLSGPRSG